MKDGLIFKSSSGADPSFYRQKNEIEARLGKRLSTDDFERNYYQPGKNSTLSDTGTSIFNAALCEILLSWFSREGDSVLDPFAGGSVRGIVANSMGRRYTGVELRAEQVDANRVQGAAICSGNEPRWICGDSAGIDDLAGDAAPYDFILTCPPYGDLEVYSDDPHDLSAMPQEAFGAAYASILRKTVALLAPDRFAAVVVGNYRDARGFLVDLAGMTVRMMETAGAGYYNDFIVVQPAGSLPIRVSKQFLASRKCGRRHQFALIFCKGSPKRATDRLGAPFLPEEIAEEDTPSQ